MIGNMKIVVEKVFPVFNKINPAVLISDSFYSLSVYNTFERYSQNIITLMIMITVFTLGGFLLTRRKKYASL
jgi:ABC-2 type transport system permease protein